MTFFKNWNRQIFCWILNFFRSWTDKTSLTALLSPLKRVNSFFPNYFILWYKFCLFGYLCGPQYKNWLDHLLNFEECFLLPTAMKPDFCLCGFHGVSIHVLFSRWTLMYSKSSFCVLACGPIIFYCAAFMLRKQKINTIWSLPNTGDTHKNLCCYMPCSMKTSIQSRQPR